MPVVRRAAETIDPEGPVSQARALAEVVRALSRRSPAPRDLPYHGLDHPPGVLGAILTDLADLGIFRHYSQVLLLDRALGGPARWLARRHGCRVTLLGRDRQSVKASRLLTERAHLAERVTEIVAENTCFPFRSEHFTHAWVIDAPIEHGKRAVALADIARVLRPGGWIGILGTASGFAPDGGEALPHDLERAGFGQVEARDVSDAIEADSAIARLVAERVAMNRVGITAIRDSLPLPVLRWKARKPS